MAKFRKKAVVVDAITFEELIEYGIKSGSTVENGLPLSFDYNGHPITNENDHAYVILTMEGTLLMTPDDMLMTGVKGEIYPCKKDIFVLTYEKEPATFLDHLEIEMKELEDKLSKLASFIGTEKFNQLEREQRNLLIDQRMYMDGYVGTLRLRIARLKQ